ncbi:hypothetical protein [Candidatus Enterococcus mangumiae]|uniref:hypothetical protein n=1 Tax=Candidatus Enterococcus mangumiae TaxID=2230878 RepID=UPI001A904746|nr:hypothetical protein [Enterococcus sp. DIV1094]MBO0489911.1 hypothetical protein [Enterococcus sp. DIV1094]
MGSARRYLTIFFSAIFVLTVKKARGKASTVEQITTAMPNNNVFVIVCKLSGFMMVWIVCPMSSVPS